MKKWLPVLIAAIILSGNLYAQNQETAFRNEIGFTLFTCMQQSTSVIYKSLSAEPTKFPLKPFGKISYKRHVNKHSFRFSINYRELDLSTDWKYFRNSGQYKETMLKAGYERELFIRKKLSPYFAADLLFLRSSAKGNGYDFVTKYEEEKVTQTGIGISPVAGLRYKFTPRFSLAMETGMDMYSTWYKAFINSDLGGKRNDIGAEFYLLANPISNFSINIKF